MCGTGFELTFWVCTALCVFWLPVTSSRPLLPHVHQFQVVWPERLPTPRARRSLDSHWNLYPDSVSYALGAGEHSFTLHLRKNRNLLASGYTETYTAANGSEVVEQLGELDHCFYQGHVEGHQDSATSISTCDGLRGFFQAGSTVHLIEPLDGEEEGRHALYLVQHLKAKPPKANHSTCGVSNANLMHILGPRIAAAFRPRSQLLPQVPRHVELYVVTDSTETQRYGDRDTLRSRVLQVVNHVDKLYQALSLRVVLVGLEMWTKDKIVVSPEPEITLANFQAWREQELLPQHPNDNAQFITNVDFTGLTVGLATVSAMCSRKVSAGVNQDQNSHYLFLASTIAHEMGHNLAMDHDENVHGCYCTVPQAEGGCVMATSMGTKYPKRFSQCSQADYEAFADTPQTECLLGELDTSKLISDPLCGNKLLERGEQCDCGSPQECKNPCCNATSCHLVPGAACAQGPCCDKCQVKPAGELCRGRKDMCDLEEYCDGHGPECPKDTFQENGTPCTEGYCYNGACPTMEERCRKLWGPDAQASEDICFTYDLLPSCHSRLQPKGVDRCTILFCQGGQQPQMHGSCTIKPQGKHCQALFVEQGGAYELVPVGTRCGEGKVCWESHCQDLDVYRIKNCSAKCNGHGVCNHENKCHCQPGWAPPHCAQPGSTVTTRKTTVSTGLSKGAVVGVVLSVLWLILLLVGIFLYHSRHKRYVAPKTSLGLANALFHKGPGDSTLRNSRAAAPTMDPPQVVSTTASPHHPRLSNSTGTPMQPLPISLLELKSKQTLFTGGLYKGSRVSLRASAEGPATLRLLAQAPALPPQYHSLADQEVTLGSAAHEISPGY
ncbi:PREDICTED: disintegrin and metalloproteinase domain-containing protein 8 [Elephantulus edwardii]|uniref:disintegrin and metalloproteinase domain-containing protein 8 n=1 Tax=Elephantulus edwardii TaxID=28737 RepID=UPI0003F0DBC7|nr:PREDICTED: disintegrin and metalloproteinase domain-containing protein 8 [Elephantulus edwardii]